MRALNDKKKENELSGGRHVPNNKYGEDARALWARRTGNQDWQKLKENNGGEKS